MNWFAAAEEFLTYFSILLHVLASTIRSLLRWTHLIFYSIRFGSRTEGPSGDVKKRWTTPLWSSTTPPCYPSIGPRCPPAWVQLPTPCRWTRGWLRPSPAPHPCTQSPGSWALRRACSPPIRATVSSTPHRAWSKACRRWAPLLTSVHRASTTRTQWRTTGVPASQHSGWKPKSTFSPWIKHGSTCDLMRRAGPFSWAVPTKRCFITNFYFSFTYQRRKDIEPKELYWN